MRLKIIYNWIDKTEAFEDAHKLIWITFYGFLNRKQIALKIKLC